MRDQIARFPPLLCRRCHRQNRVLPLQLLLGQVTNAVAAKRSGTGSSTAVRRSALARPPPPTRPPPKGRCDGAKYTLPIIRPILREHEASHNSPRSLPLAKPRPPTPPIPRTNAATAKRSGTGNSTAVRNTATAKPPPPTRPPPEITQTPHARPPFGLNTKCDFPLCGQVGHAGNISCTEKKALEVPTAIPPLARVGVLHPLVPQVLNSLHRTHIPRYGAQQVTLTITSSTSPGTVLISNIYFQPSAATNLPSYWVLMQQGLKFDFAGEGVLVFSPEWDFVTGPLPRRKETLSKSPCTPCSINGYIGHALRSTAGHPHHNLRRLSPQSLERGSA
ncbi:hypothetical protein BDK51DRAFT_50022 [Blyttiomyces helicus]|uniref:Uncharacterized protein n=1 Tax=Blyttiomyces helicus TaxID=388810 RepID=A0A4P9VWX7_9FUNG|nr:hypothetical protein BDK51DRAFT_50022 [Blyttiomyces helicus]|eukprot:RKO83365.1 hypothetical protein BDK51DRAFT_50022 [Blyttiomyces helicus]